MHSIEVTPAADRDLDTLKRRMQRRDFERLRDAARGLTGEPRPQGGAKLQEAEGAYRIRVGPYRVATISMTTERFKSPEAPSSRSPRPQS